MRVAMQSFFIDSPSHFLFIAHRYYCNIILIKSTGYCVYPVVVCSQSPQVIVIWSFSKRYWRSMARFPLAAGMLFGVIPGLVRTVRCGPETGFRHERFSGSYPGVLFSLALVPVHLRVV